MLGIFAYIGWGKGQNRVMRAILSLGRSYQNVYLLLAGNVKSPDMIESIKQAAKQAGASERLIMVGYSNEPQRYLPLIDIAVNSYVGAESFGFSVVEAMMMGKPVLVHALGGPAETVVDGVTGWHVQTPSIESFAEGIKRAISERDRWPAMGALGRARALEKYSMESFARGYVRIVQESVNGVLPVDCEVNG